MSTKNKEELWKEAKKRCCFNEKIHILKSVFHLQILDSMIIYN